MIFIPHLISVCNSVLSGTAGGVIGYLLKTYFERYREKKKLRDAEIATELKTILGLACEVQAAFPSSEYTTKVFKSSEAYLQCFNKSVLPDSIRSKFTKLNDEIKSASLLFKKEKPPIVLNPMTRGQFDEMGRKWAIEREKEEEAKKRGKEAISEIISLLRKERIRYT